MNQLHKKHFSKFTQKVILVTFFLLLALPFFTTKLFAVPTPVPTFLVTDELTSDDLENLNPLIMFGNDAVQIDVLPGGKVNLAGLINRALKYVFPLSGLLLFLMLVWGGFEMLTGVASKKNMDAGKQRVTAALIGFLLLFIAYWVAQMVEYVTGVTILGG